MRNMQYAVPNQSVIHQRLANATVSTMNTQSIPKFINQPRYQLRSPTSLF